MKDALKQANLNTVAVVARLLEIEARCCALDLLLIAMTETQGEAGNKLRRDMVEMSRRILRDLDGEISREHPDVFAAIKKIRKASAVAG